MEEKKQHGKRAVSRSQLKHERERRGWTLEYVATQINCPDPHMIGRWERGIISPSPRYRQALCELFGKGAEELELITKMTDEIKAQVQDRPISQQDKKSSITRQRSSLFSSQEHVPSEDRFFLPVQLTSFIGREQELTTVCELLRQPAVRLLTLTGTAGVGKTRLGVQAIARLVSDFTDGVRFLSLMETSSPDLVMPTIAHKLGLQEIGSQQILDLLKAFLKEKNLLLLLDNFEQVVDAAPLLSDLLGCCPHLKLLVTSRTVLRISGEQEFCVTPLALPDFAQLPERERLAQYSAIALFLQRACAVLPNFTLNEANAHVITEICAHLDGLPLAIELAVPRLKLLSPHALLARLDHCLQLLTDGLRDAPVRQQTLRNTLEWSYRLLNPSEQQLFCCLSIFVSGCTLQALETVWAMLGREQEQILEGAASLLDKSMLQRSAQEGEEPRLLMLRTIREYGLERLLLDGKLEQTQRAHAQYYLALAEEAEPALKGPRPLPWLERLEQEHDNLRQALCYLTACGEHGNSVGTEQALRLGTALERFWIIRGYVKEGRDLLERALKSDQGVSPSIRGYAMQTMMALVSLQVDLPYVAAIGEEALALFRKLGEPAGITRALCRLGSVAQLRGEYATARMYYEESLVVSRREHCQETFVETLHYFATMVFFQGDFGTARTMIEECLTSLREVDDQYGIVAALNILAWISLLQGDVQAARTLEEENLDICRELSNQHGCAHALSALGHIAYQAEDFTLAYKCFQESLAVMIRLGDRWMIAFCLEGLARVVIAQGEAIGGAHLLSIAAALREVTGASMSPLERLVYEQMLATLHERLDEPAFAAAWAEGQKMSPEQAIAARTPYPQSSPALAIREELPDEYSDISCTS